MSVQIDTPIIDVYDNYGVEVELDDSKVEMIEFEDADDYDTAENYARDQVAMFGGKLKVQRVYYGEWVDSE